jgi:hypothetical protein
MKKFLPFFLVVMMATLLADWGISDKTMALPRYGGWAKQAAVQAPVGYSILADKLAIPRAGGWKEKHAAVQAPVGYSILADKLALPRYGGWANSAKVTALPRWGSWA